MNKQEFIKKIKELIAIKKDEERLNEAFKIFEPDFNYVCFSRYEALVVRCLENAVDDKDGWISYFLYERNGKFTSKNIIQNKNGKNLPFRNFDDLWNLIKK